MQTAVNHPGYCFRCGSPLARAPSLGGAKPPACPQCRWIHYENPKILVGCVVTCADKLLLSQRALEPSRGLWALPAGFLESGESLEEGATRELMEETGIQVDATTLMPHSFSSLLDIEQVYVLFRAQVGDCVIRPGAESLAARFFAETEIPWDALAFYGAREFIQRVFEEMRSGTYGIQFHRLEGTTVLTRHFLLASQ
jgi:ADP-ribose pyrophosphatase YjhB (NUDIX family)